MTHLEWAKFYISQGLSVIPIWPGKKNPKVSPIPYRSRYATEAELKSWFANGNSDLAILTGGISNIAVVDCDGKEGINKASELGIASWVTVYTRNAGEHLYFRADKEVENSVRRYPGIDVRGEGGYVVAPPSMGYHWLEGKNTQLHNLPPFPYFVFGYKKEELKRNTPGWIEEAIENLAEGNRNDTFARIVGKLHRDGLTQGDILAMLVPIADNVGFPTDELQTVIDSITRKPQPVSLYKTLSVSDITKAPKTEWLVKPLFAKESVNILAGVPGANKTWLALDLAFKLANGGEWLGFKTEPSRVLYIDEESSFAGLSDRLKLLSDKSPSNLSFLVGQGFKFTSQEKLNMLSSLLRDGSYSLVVIDSFTNCHSADENSAVSLASVFDVIKGLVREFKCSFLLIDHEGKGAMIRDNEGISPNQYDIRGSTVKSASVDSVLTVRKKQFGMTLYHTKSRWASQISPLSFEVKNINNKIQIDLNVSNIGGNE